VVEREKVLQPICGTAEGGGDAWRTLGSGRIWVYIRSYITWILAVNLVTLQVCNSRRVKYSRVIAALKLLKLTGAIRKGTESDHKKERQCESATGIMKVQQRETATMRSQH